MATMKFWEKEGEKGVENGGCGVEKRLKGDGNGLQFLRHKWFLKILRSMGFWSFAEFM